MSHPWATVGRGKGGEYHYFDSQAEIGTEWGHNLPHWRQGGVVYFVTFRTADSIPADRLNQWKQDAMLGLPGIQSRIFQKRRANTTGSSPNAGTNGWTKPMVLVC